MIVAKLPGRLEQSIQSQAIQLKINQLKINQLKINQSESNLESNFKIACKTDLKSNLKSSSTQTSSLTFTNFFLKPLFHKNLASNLASNFSNNFDPDSRENSKEKLPAKDSGLESLKEDLQEDLKEDIQENLQKNQKNSISISAYEFYESLETLPDIPQTADLEKADLALSLGVNIGSNTENNRISQAHLNHSPGYFSGYQQFSQKLSQNLIFGKSLIVPKMPLVFQLNYSPCFSFFCESSSERDIAIKDRSSLNSSSSLANPLHLLHPVSPSNFQVNFQGGYSFSSSQSFDRTLSADLKYGQRSKYQIRSEWKVISFASSLQLSPITEKLLSHISRFWHAELRLGLQEALVNAVKHGNRLDPNKYVRVSFTTKENYYWWVIRDERTEAWNHKYLEPQPERELSQVAESGRGIEILHRIFDQVYWDGDSQDLYLGKRIDFCDLPCIY